MKKLCFTLLTALLILSSCSSSDEGSENTNTNQNPVIDFSTLQVNFNVTPEEGSCFDLTYANSACRDHICIKWNPVQGADNYKVFASDAINGTYTLRETVTETYYSSIDFEFNTPYFFYVVAYSNTDGDSLASETLELERCQMYAQSETIVTDIPFGNFITSYDSYNNQGFFLIPDINSQSEIRIVNLNTGVTTSVIDNTVFNNNINKVKVDANSDIHVQDVENSSGLARLRKFNSVTQLAYNQSITATAIRSFTIDKIQGTLFLNQQNSATIEVYDTNYNALNSFTVNANPTDIRSIIYGYDDKLYILTADANQTKSILVYDSNGTLLSEHTEIVPGFNQIFAIDGEGYLYSLLFTDSEYLIKHKLIGSEIVISSSITPMASYNPYYVMLNGEAVFIINLSTSNGTTLEMLKFEPGS